MAEPLPSDRYIDPMRQALKAAAEAANHGDVPVGRCCSTKPGRWSGSITIGVRSFPTPPHMPRSWSFRPGRGRSAIGGSTATRWWSLSNPARCAGAAVLARLDRIVYGAADLEGGGRLVALQHPPGPPAQPPDRPDRWGPRRRVLRPAQRFLRRSTLTQARTAASEETSHRSHRL